ncbi:NUDIX domain-containing protein [Fibrisoma montanum]|uniref:NUDIX domain-containing protein n=1 Tax=Fibrisoma montanum TaxID=2305895 RepID=A0A418MDH0_9BACT|nr:NUDIX domain-containing protein [Fibrisoma montanum]RIV24869.1 NUDIX domain-containing protein [Fibrisoma montanum]
MIVFIDDRPIRLVGAKAASQILDSTQQQTFTDYDLILDARLEILKEEALHGHLLVMNATPATIDRLLVLLQKARTNGLLSVTLVCADKSACEDEIKSHFKVIKAAGGVIVDNLQILLMYRRGVWDLPKGKLDDGESSREGAAREVEEETGIKVTVGERICTTWHTYSLNGSRILKRTKWYRMGVVDDSRMAPQADEDIEKLAWMDRRQVQLALTNSFSSIRYVIESLGTW